MRKIIFIALVGFVFLGAVFFISNANAKILAESLKGRILLQVEKNGEAWYVYPGNLQKYYLGR